VKEGADFMIEATKESLLTWKEIKAEQLRTSLQKRPRNEGPFVRLSLGFFEFRHC
jgi:hypothetical protein